MDDIVPRHLFSSGVVISSLCLSQVETDGLRRSIQNLGVLVTTAAVAHTSVATGEGLRHAATGQHHAITVTTKDKVLPHILSSPLVFRRGFLRSHAVTLETDSVTSCCRMGSWCEQETLF